MAICYLSGYSTTEVSAGKSIDFDSFCAVFDASQQGVLVHRRHKPLYVNQAWAALHGYNPEEIMSRNDVLDLISAEDRKRLVAYNTNRLASRSAPTRYQYRIAPIAPPPRWVEIFVQTLEWFGEPAVQCTVIDAQPRNDAIAERLQRAEATNELFLQALEEFSDGLALYDQDHRLIVWNRKFVEIYPELDGVLTPGMTYAAVVQARVDQGLIQDAIGRETAWVEERRLAFSKKVNRVDLQAADGRWYQVSLKHLADGTILQTSTDITERRQAEQALAEERSLLRAIVDNIPDAIYAKDRDAKFILKNRFDAELMGAKSTEETIGKTDFDYYPKDLAEKLYNLDMQVINHGICVIDNEECVTRLGSGQPTWLSATKIPLKNADGAIVGLVGCSRDITERKAMELDLAKHRDELEELVAERTAELERQKSLVADALDKERELSALQRHFVSMVCHEFRTPLSVIDGNAQRVIRRCDRMPSDRLLATMEKIRLTVGRLTELMETVLSAARLEAGTIAFDPEPSHPTQMIVDVCTTYRDVYPNYRIQTDLSDLPSEFYLDVKLIRQVLSNLVSNAIKYSPGGSSIWIEGKSSGDGGIDISVRDEGVGIPKAELGQLFNRFFRASTSTGIAGTGIGLNMAKALVEMHGGTIDVTSELDQGTTFSLHLPNGGLDGARRLDWPQKQSAKEQALTVP